MSMLAMSPSPYPAFRNDFSWDGSRSPEYARPRDEPKTVALPSIRQVRGLGNVENHELVANSRTRLFLNYYTLAPRPQLGHQEQAQKERHQIPLLPAL